MQNSTNYRSKSTNSKVNTLLSIQTATFLKSYQILEHQSYTPLCKRQISQIPLKALQKDSVFYLQHQQTQPTDPNQNRKLLKNGSAINALEQLMTPRAQNLTSFGKIIENVKFINSIEPHQNFLRQQQLLKEKASQEKDKMKDCNKFQCYQVQLKKVNTLLQKQQNKQRQSLSNIAYLQNRLQRIHQEKAQAEFCFRKLQHQHFQLSQKYKQLDEKLKKRIIVNLELETLMVTINIKHNQKIEELKNVIMFLQNALDEKNMHYEAKIKKIQEEHQSSKKIGQQEINSLINLLDKRSCELAELKAKQKVSLLDSQPLFDKFGISTKNSNYFVDPPLKSQQKLFKNITMNKANATFNQLVLQGQQFKEKVESPQPKMRFQSLNLQNFSFGKNRPFCKSERS